MKSVFDWKDDRASCIVKSGPVIRHPGTASPTAVRVAQFDKAGNQIATFSSMHEAERATGVDYRGIVRTVKGARKSAGGFVFKEIQA